MNNLNIKLNSLSLQSYNDRYENVIKSFQNESKSNFIHQIDDRLNNSSNLSDFSFSNAYLIFEDSNPIGYVYISSSFKDDVFVEYSLLKEYRGKGLGKKMLGEISDYLFENYNIRNIKLDIDPNNNKSMATALACDFCLDEEDFESRNYIGKMVFYKYNENYISKRRNR